MGILYNITCRNKDCRYHFEERVGPGWTLRRWIFDLRKEIIDGEEKAPQEIVEMLKKGCKLHCVSTFLCPTCKEWQTHDDPYIFEPIVVSPYGTIREYKIHYVYGTPVCEKCGTELEYIINPRSSKCNCPKCGEDNMKVSFCGYYD